MRKNSELVKFAKNAVGSGYIYGTYGQVCTSTLIDNYAKKYPLPTQAGGEMKVIAEKWLAKRVMDCSGLFKYFYMSESFGDDPIYNTSYDLSSIGLINSCVKRGDMKDLPEIPGLLLWRKGHVGLYIGGGMVVESISTKYGVVYTKLNIGNWDKWGMLKDIDYCDTLEIIDIEEALDKLSTNGIINNRDYWIKAIGTTKYVSNLLIIAANNCDKYVTHTCTEWHQALTLLNQRGIVNTPEYWANVIKTTNYIDLLIISIANHLKEDKDEILYRKW